jgi:hypothetical protein
MAPELHRWVQRKARAESITMNELCNRVLFAEMVRDEMRAEAERIRTDPDALAKIIGRIGGDRP